MNAARSDTDRLRAIRHRLDRMPVGDWSLAADEGVMCIMRPGQSFRDGTAGDDEQLLLFTEAANADEMAFVADSVSDARFLLDLVDRAAARIRELVPPAEAKKDFAAEAAMKCTEPAFQRFLAETCGGGAETSRAAAAIEPDKQAAARLRSILRVSSRGDLNHDPGAAERWKRLRQDFYDWLKARG